MASFDFSGISKGGTQKSYSFLVDALSIKENSLASDGNLSPGDYKLLKSVAMDAYNHPGLTPEDRSKLAVKISEYDKNGKVAESTKNDDITALNNSVKDENSKQSMLLGNNPAAIAQARSDTLKLKLSQLSSTIEDLSNSGKDSTSAVNEFNSTLSEFNDAKQAVQDIQGGQANPGKPSGSTVAYLTTNSKGEITDVQFGRVGSKSGYAETNGLYGGLTIYGKVNQKTDGKNIFKIGGETFSAADIGMPDPANPGLMKVAPLTSDDQKTALGGGFNSATAGQYKPVDLSKVRTQSYIPEGSFAKSTSGFLYKNNGGKYTKYTNVDPKTVGANDQNTISIPSEFEQNLSPSVSETIDGSVPFAPPMSSLSPAVASTTPGASAAVAGPVAALPGAGTPGVAPGAPAPAPAPAGRPNTPVPTSTAPTTAGGIAAGAFKGASNFLSGLFK